MAVKIFLRNDDVNTLDKELKELWRIIEEEDVCIDMAVEPANITNDTVDWLKTLKKEKPESLSIITHGYDHIDKVPGMGEFGGREYKDQLKDIVAGRKIMDGYFGGLFFPAFTCPRGGHNLSTIRCMDKTDYKVFSSYHNVYLKNKVLYMIGRSLNKKFIMGKRISYHTHTIPGTKLRDISMSMSLIRRYFSDDDCEFPTVEYLRNRLHAIRSAGQTIIGVTLHHRYHKKPEDMQLIRDAIQMFKEEGCEFRTIEQLYSELAR